MNKNLWLLILSQIFAFTAAPVTVFLSGIIGSQFSPIKSLATLPMALSIVGVAIFAFFAAKVMSIIGRRAGFMFASIGSSLVITTCCLLNNLVKVLSYLILHVFY